MQSTLCSVHHIKDVYTAEQTEANLLLTRSLDYGSLACIHVIFSSSHVTLHNHIWVSYHPGLESKCCVALFPFLFSPLSCPWRGFCCCISTSLLCVQEVREQTSERLDLCSPLLETNKKTEHKHNLAACTLLHNVSQHLFVHHTDTHTNLERLLSLWPDRTNVPSQKRNLVFF